MWECFCCGEGSCGVAGDVDDGGVECFDEVVGGGGLLVGFSGVADDDVGDEGEVGEGLAEGVGAVEELGGGVAAVHGCEDGVVACLDGEVEEFVDLGVVVGVDEGVEDREE